MDLRAQQAAGEKRLIGLGAIGGIGPDVAGGVVRIDQFGQQRPIVARRIADPPTADQAMPAIDAEMIFITKGRDRQIDARPALCVRFGFGVFDRPACVAVLLAQLGWLALLPIVGECGLL
jgi:hypothetical protein